MYVILEVFLLNFMFNITSQNHTQISICVLQSLCGNYHASIKNCVTGVHLKCKMHCANVFANKREALKSNTKRQVYMQSTPKLPGLLTKHICMNVTTFS